MTTVTNLGKYESEQFISNFRHESFKILRREVSFGENTNYLINELDNKIDNTFDKLFGLKFHLHQT